MNIVIGFREFANLTFLPSSRVRDSIVKPLSFSMFAGKLSRDA